MHLQEFSQGKIVYTETSVFVIRRQKKAKFDGLRDENAILQPQKNSTSHLANLRAENVGILGNKNLFTE